MENVSFESKSQKVAFYTIENLEDRYFILRDFDVFLRSQQEYRNGNYAVIPLFKEGKECLEITFFNDNPPDDDKFEIANNNVKNIIEITTISGNKNRITPSLEKFGFSAI